MLILHVEDDLDIQEVAKLALEFVGGHEVVQFASARNALLEAGVLSPALVLLDMMMPEMTGVDLMNELRQLPGYEKLPYVFMTARAQDSEIRTMLADGATAVISKPFDPLTLSAELEAIVAANGDD